MTRKVLAFVCCLAPVFPAFAQEPVQPRAVRSETRPDVEAYRRLRGLPLSSNRLEAYKSFVARFPGRQLSLRVMREAVELYLLEPASGRNDSLVACGEWLGAHLDSPEFAWEIYRTAPNSVMLDRAETHVQYALILASSSQTYEKALRELTQVQTAMTDRPEILRARGDLSEKMDFARCWCLHGLGHYPEALSSYRSFLERYPSSDFTPAALRYAAMCLRSSGGNPAHAEVYRQRLLEEFSASPEAVMLRQELEN